MTDLKLERLTEEEITRHMTDHDCPECGGKKLEGQLCVSCGFGWGKYFDKHEDQHPAGAPR